MMEVTGEYNLILVAISILAACGAAFVAVSTVPRIYFSTGRRAANLWSLGFGLSLGSGIWCMHFIAMLALRLPLQVHYDIPLSALSLIIAIAFSTLGILPFRMRGSLSGVRLALTGTYMGLGIAGMHYSGMMAMHMPAGMVYNLWLVALSLLIAIAASTAALWIANRLRAIPILERTRLKIGVSAFMGIAVSGMHYMGMAATTFVSNSNAVDLKSGMSITLLIGALVTAGALLQTGILFLAERAEARQAWKKSQDNETNLLNLLNILPDGIVVLVDDVIVFANPAAQDLMCQSCPTLLESRMSQFFPPQKREGIRQWMDEVLQSGYASPISKERLLRPDGSSFDARLGAVPVRWNGRPAIQVIMHDLTGEKRRMSELARLITAVNHASDIIFSLDAEGRVQTVNRTGLEFIGLPMEDIQGHLFKEFLPPESLAVALEMFGKKVRGEAKQTHYEIMMRDHAGKAHDMEVRTRGMFEDGQFSGVVAVARDVTMEREQQAKMEHTQRLESLGVLAGGIAHDFNNLLTAILGNAALAERKLLKRPEEVGQHLVNIVTSSETAADLCRQMLAYSGKGRFVVRHINLSHMVEEIGNLLHVSIAKNVTLHFRLTDHLPDVQVDLAQMQQVIMNLLINASDAIGERNGDITISTGLTEADANELRSAHAADDVQPGEFVYLEVTDNGSGMDKSVQEKLFDPFFTTKFTGRGLGMSAVLGIVRGHHGAIRLISEPGKGSTFRVLLPASAGDGEAETAPAAAESLSPACGMVLIVDDELPVRETARLMLEDFGFTTMTAADGVEGVAAYREHLAEIVAVLLDMTMPNMDGRTCFAELKRINPDVKVLLSSGYNEQETTTRFTGQGLSGFLQKPYTPEALRSKIREVLDS